MKFLGEDNDSRKRWGNFVTDKDEIISRLKSGANICIRCDIEERPITINSRTISESNGIYDHIPIDVLTELEHDGIVSFGGAVGDQFLYLYRRE